MLIFAGRLLVPTAGTANAPRPQVSGRGNRTPGHSPGPGSGLAVLLLIGLIDRPDHQAGHREPAHHGHRREGVPAQPAQQPLRLIRRPVPDVLSDRSAIPLVRPLATALTYLQACSHGSTRVKHAFSRSSSSARFRRASPPPILAAATAFGFCFSHRRMIVRRLRRADAELEEPAADLVALVGVKTKREPFGDGFPLFWPPRRHEGRGHVR